MSTFGSAIRLEYLFVDKYEFKTGWVFPKNTVPYSMFRYIVKGSAIFIINEEEILVQKGQIVYIPQSSTLHCEARDENVTFISVRFTSSVRFESLDVWTDQYGIVPIVHCTDEFVQSCFYNMVVERDSNNAGKAHKMKGCLEFIMAYMMEQGSVYYPPDRTEHFREKNDIYSLNEIYKRSQNKTMKTDTRIQAAVEYLVLNQNKKVELEELHSIVDLSPSAFRRLFKSNTGKSPKSFMEELRMTSAARQLLSTNERISAIASNLQFENQNYFSRQFKKNFGVTPREYRQLAR